VACLLPFSVSAVCVIGDSMDYVGVVVDEIALEGLDGKSNPIVRHVLLLGATVCPVKLQIM